jgi:N-acetylglucosaminyldiphosphoundecaprenol N-acetyl-beta-D-mannosaminyltransferase
MNSSFTVPLMDFCVYKKELSHIPLAQKTLINTINQYSFCIAQQDTEFKQALQGADVLLADGVAIVASVRLIHGTKIKKIAGAQLHEYLLKKLNENGGSCFYLGSSENTLSKIIARLNTEFPNVKVQTYSPPFKTVFSNSDNHKMIEAVNNFKPDVLFIGMTAPKQEKWAFTHKNELNATTICAIGAVFDFYAGTIPRPSKFWINLGLEWFIRLIKEPKRMWKRYLYYGPLFIASVIKEKIS